MSELWDGKISKSWQRKLETVQNKFGKAVLAQTKSMPASCAVRADLGLPSLESRRRQLKLGYWYVLCCSHPDRLLHHIFLARHRELLAGGAKRSCLNSFRECLVSVGLQSSWASASVKDDWGSLTRSLCTTKLRVDEQVDMLSKSSLSMFSQLNHQISRTHPYLYDRGNLRGTRLKTSLRFGTLWVMRRVASILRLPPCYSACMLCRSGSIEDSSHFLLSCPVLRPPRIRFLSAVKDCLPLAGSAGRSLLATITSAVVSNLPLALRLLAGEQTLILNSLGIDEEQHAVQCGKAFFILDKLSKDFLVQCWRLRASLIGSFSVSAGCLEILQPPVRVATTVIPDQTEVHSAVVQSLHHRLWLPWVPRLPNPPAFHRPGKRRGWHVVWRGRERGLFYRWCDALLSVAGIPDALHKGFYSLSNATDALEGRDYG